MCVSDDSALHHANQHHLRPHVHTSRIQVRHARHAAGRPILRLHSRFRTFGTGWSLASASSRSHSASCTDDGSARIHPTHAKLLGDFSESQTALIEPPNLFPNSRGKIMATHRLPGTGDDLPNGAAADAEPARNLLDGCPSGIRCEDLLTRRVAQTSLSFQRPVHDLPANVTPHSLRRTVQESPFPAQRPRNQ